jgi:molybdopterin adenylyltransferase
MPGDRRNAAFVLTVSDGVTAGTRADESGDVLAERLSELGFAVDRASAPDDRALIARAVGTAAARFPLIVTTGGTGLGPRDVTPQALRDVLEYEVPGFGEAMRAAGRLSTPMADLSRSMAGVRGRCLVVAVPGSPRAAVESIEAVVPLLQHALETLAGLTPEHPVDTSADAAHVAAAAEEGPHGAERQRGDAEEHAH